MDSYNGSFKFSCQSLVIMGSLVPHLIDKGHIDKTYEIHFIGRRVQV